VVSRSPRKAELSRTRPRTSLESVAKVRLGWIVRSSDEGRLTMAVTLPYISSAAAGMAEGRARPDLTDDGSATMPQRYEADGRICRQLGVPFTQQTPTYCAA
jgi:hypothetical protein